MKDRITGIANEKGYEIQFENNSSFRITQNDITYCYKYILGKISLKKIYMELAPVTDIKVKDNIGKITITVLKKDKFDVALEDSIIEINNQGKEMTVKEHIRFVCSSEFTLESLDRNNIVSQIGKAEKNYNKITNNYISSDRLRKIYEEGKIVVEELN